MDTGVGYKDQQLITYYFLATNTRVVFNDTNDHSYRNIVYMYVYKEV